MKVEKYISLDECEDSYLYLIVARNSYLGIYNEKDKSFTISRFKFKSNYLFDEYHWDSGQQFGTIKLGTVKPLEKICEVGQFENDEEKLKYLNDKVKEKEIIDLMEKYGLIVNHGNGVKYDK